MRELSRDSAGVRHSLAESDNQMQNPQSRCYKSAIISSQHSMTTVRGLVRNNNKIGVQLEVEDVNAIPHYFQLEVLRDRYIVDCSISWRSGNMIGADFESELIEVPRLNIK